MASQKTGKAQPGGKKPSGKQPSGRQPGAGKAGGGKKPTRSAAQQRPAPDRQRPPLPPRRMMPVPLQNTLIGLIIFTLTLGAGIIFQYVFCALALGIAVYQLWNHRARWLWTWTCFVAVGLYVVGVYLALHYQPAWFLYFGAWILVIVALVGEVSRTFRRRRPAHDEPHGA